MQDGETVSATQASPTRLSVFFNVQCIVNIHSWLAAARRSQFSVRDLIARHYVFDDLISAREVRLGHQSGPGIFENAGVVRFDFLTGES